MKGFIGNSRKTHPIPIRLRNCMIDKEQGGGAGYRGPEFQRIRRRILYLGRYRSSATGLPQGQTTLMVDHILPYRIGGLSSHTNSPGNLRILDSSQNKYLDYAEGFQEKKVSRRLRAF